MKAKKSVKAKKAQNKKDAKGSNVATNATSSDIASHCIECAEQITDATKALQCEMCDVEWKCSDCMGFTDEQYEFISSCSCLYWFCHKCEKEVLSKSATGLGQINATLNQLVKKVETFEQRLGDTVEKKTVQELEEKIEKLCTNATKKTIIPEEVQECVEGALRNQFREDKVEEEEIQKRRTSVIIHGVTESTADSSEQRLDEDSCQMAAMLHELESDDVPVKQVIRLGKRQLDPNAKPRPIKLVTDTEDNKLQLIVRAKNLRDKKEGGWDRVFIHQDLTPKQREARKLLVQELRRRQAQGETDLMIAKGNIVRRRNRQMN